MSDEQDPQNRDDPEQAATPGGETSADEAPASERAKQLGRATLGQAKAAGTEALSAIRRLLADPLGGQVAALRDLGDKRALQAGIVFIAVFVIVVFFTMYFYMLSPISQFTRIGVGGYIKSLLACLVAPAALFGAFFGVAKLSQEQVTLHACVFTTGVTLLPVALASVLLLLFGKIGGDVVYGIVLFGLSITVLVLHASLTDVFKLSSRKAVLMTPAVILVASYFSKALLSMIGP